MIAAFGIYVIVVTLLILCLFHSSGREYDYDLDEQAAILDSFR